MMKVIPVAQQCPYKGGKAVYRARTWISLFNDTIVYDDAAVCFQEGIYRGVNSIPVENVQRASIQIIPNPANDKAEVILHGIPDGVCYISLIDALGQTVQSTSFNCKEKKHTLNISKLVPGVYGVHVKVNQHILSKQKLVIIR